MQDRHVSIPELVLVAVTRGMLGFGAGLLVSGHLGRDRRKLVGTVLVGIGALSTIPLALRVFGRRTNHDASIHDSSFREPRVNPGAETMAD